MRTDAFDYELPPSAIAQTPIEPRHAARMLVDLGAGPPVNHVVDDLDSLLEPGDVVVVNNTKVLAARLNVFKPTGGAVEVLLLEATGRPDEWQALVRPSRRVPDGMTLQRDGQELVEVGSAIGDGRRLVTVNSEAVETIGEVPLPPYIVEPLHDPDRYQTVFADRLGSVAAPTAGLHLTDSLLDRLRAKGVTIETVELFVGLGTFRPITSDVVDEHTMHSERYVVEAATWQRLQKAKRIVAVGTTVVRTLESVAASGELEGSTDLFIKRGFDWQMVDLLMTNFHVPRSSLLVLVDAFIGDDWKLLYQKALADGYRFLSFGDAMLLARRPLTAQQVTDSS